MKQIPTITTDALVEMLSSGEAVNIIDIRPKGERIEWFIPGSIHADVYNKLKQHDKTVFDNIHLEKSIPVVTVCAEGKTSLVATNILRQKGYNAFSLQEGMKGWSLASNTAHRQFGDFDLWQVRRTGKGCLSYILASNGEAVIIDASLPVKAYIQLIKQHHLSVKCVIETHIHADHLSRSREVAKYFQAPLYLPTPNKVQFEYNPIKADTFFQVGSVLLQSIPTPGHTLDSFSFYIIKQNIADRRYSFYEWSRPSRPDIKCGRKQRKSKIVIPIIAKIVITTQ